MKTGFRKSLFLNVLVLATTFLTSYATFAQDASVQSLSGEQMNGSQDLDYGEMYVVQKHETPKNPYEVGFNYSFGFSNPYFNSHGFSLSAGRQLGDFFMLGLSGSYFYNSNSNMTTELQNNLSNQGYSTFIYKPEYSAYLNFSVIPLSGLLNWFSTKSLNFDLPVGIAGGMAGYRKYTRICPSLRFFVTPKLMLTESVGVTAGIISTWDHFSSSDWMNRIDTTLGVFYRF